MRKNMEENDSKLLTNYFRSIHIILAQQAMQLKL